MLCFNGDASVYGNYCIMRSSLIINMISILVLSGLFCKQEQ